MNPNRATDYLEHMLEAAALACSYIEGLSQADFLADKRTQQAVVMNIVVIGEAATKLTHDHPDFVDQHPSVPWKSMKGMRNRIAHGYFDIDLNIVWDTMQVAMPQLVHTLTAIRDELGNSKRAEP